MASCMGVAAPRLNGQEAGARSPNKNRQRPLPRCQLSLSFARGRHGAAAPVTVAAAQRDTTPAEAFSSGPSRSRVQQQQRRQQQRARSGRTTTVVAASNLFFSDDPCEARAPIAPSPELINEDLAPVTAAQRTFTTYDIAALW